MPPVGSRRLSRGYPLMQPGERKSHLPAAAWSQQTLHHAVWPGASDSLSRWLLSNTNLALGTCRNTHGTQKELRSNELLMLQGVKRTASGAGPKMETNPGLQAGQSGANGGSQASFSWAGLGRALGHPPGDVMLAPASTAHVWAFQPVRPSPRLSPTLSYSFFPFAGVQKQISEAKSVSWLPGRASTARMEGPI